MQVVVLWIVAYKSCIINNHISEVMYLYFENKQNLSFEIAKNPFIFD